MFATITLFALFRVEIYALYKLIPHYSDAGSLCYTAVFLCRVIPTLCYNYLQIVGVTQADQVAFYQVMGILRVDGLKEFIKTTGLLEIIGGGFTNYFPMVMIIVSVLTLLRVVDKIASLFGEKRFNFHPKISETDEDVIAGKTILEQARKKRLSTMNLEDLQDADTHATDESRVDIDDNGGFDLELQEEEEDVYDDKSKMKRSTSRRLDNLYKKRGKDRPVKVEKKGLFGWN
jgi:hypothetical protein